MATAAEINEIIKLYVGYYNRAPDALGLNFWINAFDNGFSLAAMAVDFSTQPETRANYPFFDPAQKPNPTLEDLGIFIEAVYDNLFNRPPDEAGKDFWAGKINSGEFTVGQAISLIIEGAAAPPPPGASPAFIAQQQADKAVVDNKVAAGLDFYNDLNAAPGGATYVFTPADVTAATNIQKSVTVDPASLATAAAATDAYIASSFSGTPTAVTVNLTTSADQPGGGSGADTQGTSNDDTYNAIGAPTPFFGQTTATLNDTDNIAAGEGTDSLNLRVVDLQFISTTVSPSATGLENFFVTVQDTSSVYTLDFAAISGEAQVWGINSGESAVFMANNVDMGTVAGLENYDGTYAINYKGTLGGSDDSFSAVFNGAGDDTTNPAFFRTVNTSGNTVTGFEVVNITSTTAASRVQFDTMSLRDINVQGDAALELFEASNFAGLESVDASGNTGGTNVNALAATASNFMFMGGDGTDRVSLSSSLLNNGNNLSLDGGGGKDTLATNTWSENVIASAVNAASSFEVLENTSSTSTASLDANKFTNIDEFLFSAARTTRTNIANAETADRFVIAEDQSSSGGDALTFSGEVVGTDITIEITHKAGSDGTLITSTSNNNNDATIEFGNNVDEVNLISTGATNNANEILHQASNNDHFVFKGDGVNDFRLTGDTDLTILAREGINLDASSDFRGFFESVNFDASDFTGNLRIAGSGFADAIVGGSGNDIIYGMGGANQLTGNDGSDQFRFSNFNDGETVTDFEVGADKIGLNEVNFGNTNASAAGTTLASADYIENVNSISGLSSAEDNKLVELQSGASNDQISTSTSSASVDAFVLVFNTDTNKAELYYDNDWSTSSSRNQVMTFDNIETLVDTVGLSNTDFVEYVF